MNKLIKSLLRWEVQKYRWECGHLSSQEHRVFQNVVCPSQKSLLLRLITWFPLTVPACPPKAIDVTDHRSAFEALIAPRIQVLLILQAAPLIQLHSLSQQLFALAFGLCQGKMAGFSSLYIEFETSHYLSQAICLHLQAQKLLSWFIVHFILWDTCFETLSKLGEFVSL